MTFKSRSEIMNLKIEENEILKFFVSRKIFFVLYTAAPINNFLFQMIKPIANFHNTEFKGIIRASSRHAKPWTADFRTYLFFTGNYSSACALIR